MCAGVQNESRPMLLCQEMSHSIPATENTTESMQHQMYQRIAVISQAVRWAARMPMGCARGMLFAIIRFLFGSFSLITESVPYPTSGSECQFPTSPIHSG